MSTTNTPELVRTPKDLRALTHAARREGCVVGFVPTMGALHRGHLRLVEVAKENADVVVVSIFVNPTQFGPGEDLDRYPRDLEGDIAKCARAGASIVYAPSVAVMYPEGAVTNVTVAKLSEGLCGRSRPVHFSGVATVVCKLFNQVGPCIAVFGRKDYQQLTIIRRLVKDLAFEVEIVGVPTVREPDGLALSSRNAYLSKSERPRALALVRGLSEAVRIVRERERPSAGEIRKAVYKILEQQLDSVDYVEVCDPENLVPLDPGQAVTQSTLVAVAGHLGTTRLIDNIVLYEQSDPLSVMRLTT